MSAAPVGYSAAQKALHWTIAVIVFVMVPVGISMANIMPDGPVKNSFYEMHKSFGIIVFALALIRICLRLWRGAPPLVAGMPEWQRAAAHISHYALYVLIVAVPLAGWVATSSCCAPVNVFWTVPVTLPVSGEEEFRQGGLPRPLRACLHSHRPRVGARGGGPPPPFRPPGRDVDADAFRHRLSRPGPPSRSVCPIMHAAPEARAESQSAATTLDTSPVATAASAIPAARSAISAVSADGSRRQGLSALFTR